MCDKRIKIRSANITDCEDLYTWRSDHLSRSMSFTNTIPSLEEHRSWFKSSLIDVNCKLYIGEVSSSKVGICRFDFNKTNSYGEVSIIISPRYRGRGFGKKFLSSSIERYLKYNEHNLLAKIKSENIASLNIFKSVGFKPVSTKGDMITLIRACRELLFKEIDVDDSEMLFELLKRRVHSISHNKLPTKDEHLEFVKEHPYRYWAMLLENGCPIGTLYLQEDNSIGLNILEPSQHLISEVLLYIRENFIPSREVKSKTPPYFWINVPHENEKLHKLLLESEAIPIQISYKI